jgi:hypothetical protein
MKPFSAIVTAVLFGVVGTAAPAYAQHFQQPPHTQQQLPLSFEANVGQTSSDVEFIARGPRYTLFLTRAGAGITFSDASGAFAVHMRPLEIQHSVTLSGEDELPGRTNYIRGNDPAKWMTDVHTYGAVRYRNVYHGVDLIFEGANGKLEYSFILAPGSNERQVAMNIDGADNLAISKDGDLLIQTGGRTISFQKPIAYERGADRSLHSTEESHRHFLEAKYVLDHNRVRFRVSGRHATRTLVIDPVLNYSTYVGGSSQDYGTNIVVDSSGNAYAAGYTSSVDFPTTAGAFQTACSACGGSIYDVYLLKLNATGSAVLYSTYLGGSSNDYAYGLFVDSAGHAYVVGQTSSADFPVTPGAYQTTCGGGCTNPDGFVTELNSSGSGLIYSTYIGGSGLDRVDAIVVDSSGNAYLAGGTQSSNFPVTLGVFQPTCNCALAADAFVAEMNPAGTSLIYASYLGGSLQDLAYSIAIDAAGNAFVTGYTDSSDFPVTTGAFQTTLNAPVGAFVSKVSPGATSLIYSTYLGGSSTDSSRVCYACGTSVLVDSNGNALVCGLTLETDFPTTPGAYQTILDGTAFGHDAFVTSLNSSGTGLLYSTLIGGKSDDGATSVAVDSSGNIYVRGNTLSTDFPVTDGAVQKTSGGGYDAFVAQFDPTLSKLLYSSYLGGGGNEFGMATHNLALDSQSPPNVFVTGYTSSTNFPTTKGVLQLTSYGENDAFITKFNAFAPLVGLAPVSLTFHAQTLGAASGSKRLTISNTGYVDLSISSVTLSGVNATDFQVSNPCSTVVPAAACVMTVTFDPLADGTRTATITITDNANSSPQSVALQGVGTEVSLSSGSLSFPPQTAGTTSSPLVATLTNVGTTSLSFTSIKMAGKNLQDFAQTNTCIPALAAGATCTISVTFTPASVGSWSASISIKDNGGSSPQTISLTGTGT